jgi:hypothetical protein
MRRTPLHSAEPPKVRYAVEVEHYRFNGACDMGLPSFGSVPKDTVT